ncbi:MAG: hypothetical protein FWD40_02525 [Treponema sp.]|nr:hypothetical protein [Treponema sp.]
MKTNIFIKLFIFFISFGLLHANTAGSHNGGITGLIHKGDTVLSCGEDGFLVTWNIGQKRAVERFQLTTYKIKSIASHPLKNEFCIIEDSGTEIKISAWDYSRKQRLFTVSVDGPVTFINYSAGGNYILTAVSGGHSLLVMNSSTGELAFTSPSLESYGAVTFAVTGRTERNMLIYHSVHSDSHGRLSSAGQISYMDLQSMNISGSFQAPGYLTNPLIFGNSRFLAGINREGLHIVDATSGEIFETRNNIREGALLFPFNDGFYCLGQNSGSTVLYRFTVDRNGRLVENRQTLSLASHGPVSAIASNASGAGFVLASSAGNILLPEENIITPFTSGSQIRITEISAGTRVIAFFDEDSNLYFLPNNPSNAGRAQARLAAKMENYTELTHILISGEDHFIAWQDSSINPAPLLINSNGQTVSALNFMVERHPLRSVSVSDNRILVLDSTGKVSVYNHDKAQADFTYSAVGAIDASLMSNDYILISRTRIGSTSPFIFVNAKTGETVPVSPSAEAGIYVFSGGKNYAFTITRSDNRIRTSFLELSVSAPFSHVLFEYQGEAQYLSIAESQGRIAFACGNEGALIISNVNTALERTPGLPVKLQSFRDFFISLDSEGNIAWHNNNTGRITGLFSLNP